MGLSVRERTEELERSSLSRWATVSSQSKGRERPEPPDPLRSVFQVDRDRILYSAAFRRLADKTHCFIPDRDAHGRSSFRTRLSHTLTVAQIARTVARGLRANEDLVEAIALGADLGGTPYGYSGEEALASMLDPPFRHDEQSLRIVESIENGGRGLNLSWEVRDGILHHSWSMPPAATWEGQIVRLATRIALVTHDVSEAFRAGLVSRDELPAEVVSMLGASAGERVSGLVSDVITTSDATPEVRFSESVDDAQHLMMQFLKDRALSVPAVEEQRDRALHVIRSLVVFFLEAPEVLPGPAQGGDGTEQRVVDHLSSLGDRAVGRLFVRTFMPGVDR